MSKKLPVFSPEKTVYLIDGSSFLYRAYYAIRPMHSPTGEPTQAIFGFCRMIKKLIDTFKPQYCALVWDSKGKTTRHEVYEEYKATRQAPPSDLFEQKERIIEFADLIGLAQVQEQGIEADDLMYSIAQERKQDSDSIVFVTADKDMGQALDDKTYMYDTFKEELYDVAKMEEKFGFPIDRLPLYFAMLGDASDNIPGVRGIGKKGAEELAQQFGSLEELYRNLDKVSKARTKKALEDHKEEAFLSRDLFLLQYHNTGIEKDYLSFSPDNWHEARPLFEELNFKSLLRDMGSAPIHNTPLDTRYTFKKVTTRAALDELCAALHETKLFALDTEGCNLKPHEGEMVGFSFCTKEGVSYYVPIAHRVDETQLSKEEVFAALRPILENPEYKKILHHAKFDMHVLAHAGIMMQGLLFDTMIAASLLAKEDPRVGLKDLSLRCFGERMLTYSQVVTEQGYENFSYVPLDLATQYAAADAHQTFKLYHLFSKELKQAKQLCNLFYEIEMPLVSVLFEMEYRGIYIDVAALQNIDVSVVKELEHLYQEIVGHAGEERKDINLNSPKQVEELLFSYLQLPPQKKSAKGSYSTDQEVLSALAPLHVVPALILKYRELFKLKSTYIDALPTYVNASTHRIHTTFRQTGVITGRLSSSDPNLQNIPAEETGYAARVRAAFKPTDEHVFLSADYSQIELRILAYFSQDSALKNAFLHNHDIHAETASRLFDVPLDQVSHDQRQIGKRINFSILYGLTPYGLSKDLHISFKDAKHYIEKYFEQYPAVSGWMEAVIQETKDNGYVETFWGRRRYVPGIHEKNKTLYDEACRVAVNTKAQGTAAEIMKKGMLAVDHALKKQGLQSAILLQIHDELLLTVPKKELDVVQHITKEALELVVSWDVPLVVTIRHGADWHEVTK